MSESTQKLTKRQQKALAHRSGASRQDKKKAKRDQLESLSGLPQEDLDENDGQDGDAAATAEESAPKASTAKAKGKKKADAAGQGEGDAAAAAAQDGDSEGPAKPKKNHRFICFCGNLPYNVTKENLAQYFQFEGNIPRVRLMTTKPKEGEQESKPKGFAFLEFTAPTALQNALKLHHSTLSGRKINVELSAGGGGNSEARRAKIDTARTKLDKERSDKIKKVKEKKEKSKEEKARDRENESKTSAKKRKRAEDEEQAAVKKVKKPWLSGANAMKLG